MKLTKLNRIYDKFSDPILVFLTRIIYSQIFKLNNASSRLISHSMHTYTSRIRMCAL